MDITSFAHRWRRHLRAAGSNPLIRLSDRLEALAVLAVFCTALIAFPVAAHAGSWMYSTAVSAAEEQMQNRHPVEAQAVEASAALSADFDNPAYVRVQWRDGAQWRTEGVIAPAALKPGESLTIWLDDSGKVVAAPQTTEDAELSAAVAAVTVWTSLVAASALLAFVIRRALDRSRDRAWERELLLLSHNDDGWANRRT